MKERQITNTLLLFIVVPLFFYLLKILSFIFIPLIASMFISVLFLPIMRWFKKKKVPRALSIVVVIMLVAVILKIGIEMIQLMSNEILSTQDEFFAKAETRVVLIIASIETFLGIDSLNHEGVILNYLKKSGNLRGFGSTLHFISDSITNILMTIFFVLLLLSESINFQKILNRVLFKQNYSSVKTFMQIETDIIKFIVAKFVISMFTGIGFTLVCIFFDVSFPIFWGLFAFAINFIQMIGSVISVFLLSIFAFVEIEPTGTLLLFILCITAVQVLMGGILEPIFMGKTFSVNVITVLVMLMLWGYIWGLPGLIMSIPITVFIKIIFEQFPNTKTIALVMSGSETKLNLFRKKG